MSPMKADKRIDSLEALGTDALMAECVRIARKIKPNGSNAVAVEIVFCGDDEFGAVVRHSSLAVVDSYRYSLNHGYCETHQRALATAVVMLRNKARDRGIKIQRKR